VGFTAAPPYIVVAAAILHDSSVLVEREGPDGQKSEIGKTFLHAQLGGVRCYEAGLPNDIANMVSRHPYTPPHIYIEPPNIESVILAYADLGASDSVAFLEKRPTHLDIRNRFFSLD
jgi:hypothetical protein